MSNYEEFDFPAELKAQPLPLVGISGLDIVNNAVHRNIWEAFNNIKKQNRSMVEFKLINPDHEFPRRRPKRTSYDAYIPKGILKKNWMDKHMNHIPAVVVFFYDLDWNDPQWLEKQTECASRVKSLKLTLEGRHTKIAVVLIQQHSTIPAGEEDLLISNEKSMKLIEECEINNKYLLLLPYTHTNMDQIQGCIIKLHEAFYEMCVIYLNTLIRDIKSHRNNLNKNLHIYLYIRHLYKMGFYSEMKREYMLAQRYYVQAYNIFNNNDVKYVYTNIYECKVIISYIIYKIYNTLFIYLNQPRDAIQFYHNYIDLFKNKLGNEELLFEHYAWLHKQYSTFADTFETTIRNGQPASQTRHPGFYYQQAAKYCTSRKAAMIKLCSNVTSYPEIDPLIGQPNVEYYGQRPWRPGKLSAEALDMKKEKEGIQALQFIEKHVNHSMLIIGLLSNAIGQFNTYRCPRMKKYLVIQMSEEYLSSKDYGKALTLMTHMISDYRKECWWSIVLKILKPALYCATITGCVREYLEFSFEAIARFQNDAEKIEMLDNIYKVLHNEIPVLSTSQYDTTYELTEKELIELKEMWNKHLKHVDNSNIELQMNPKYSFIELKNKIIQNNNYQYFVELYIRSNIPKEITFTSLICTIGHIDLTLASNLTLPPHDTIKLEAEFLPQPRHINMEVSVSNVSFIIETSSRNLVLKFALPQDPYLDLPLWRIPKSRTGLEFENIKSVNNLLITPNNNIIAVEINHSNPALLLEWYPITIKLSNENNTIYKINNVNIAISNTNNVDDIDVCEDSKLNEESMTKLPLNIAIDNMTSDNVERILYFRCKNEGMKVFPLKVTYSLSTEPSIVLVKDDFIKLDVIKAFEITASYMSTTFEPITSFHTNEPVIIQPIIDCISPWNIIIEHTYIDVPDCIEIKDQTDCNLELNKGESACAIACIEIKESKNVSLGLFTVKWRRKHSNSSIVTSCIELPTVNVISLPMTLHLKLPANGLVRTPMTISYSLRHFISSIVTVQIVMESSEAFMFSGYKKITLKLIPDLIEEFQFKLYPQLSGLVALPEFKINLLSKHNDITQQDINDMIQRTIPTHIFVLPQPKCVSNDLMKQFQAVKV